MKKEHWFLRVLPLLLLVAVILSATNIYLIQLRKTQFQEAVKLAEEEARPAVLQLVKITVSNCEFCFDLEKAVEELKKQNVNITQEEAVSSDSELGKELIEKYGIEKLPTYITGGEINKSSLARYFAAQGEVRDNRVIFTAQKAPYFDTTEQKIRGQVSLYSLQDSSCGQCTDLSAVPKALEDHGVLLVTKKPVEYSSQEGQQFIQKFGVKEIPALLISNDIEYYPEVLQQLTEAGATEKEGFYAVHAVAPPYRDLAKNKVVGLVDVVYLADESCTDCYDVTINRRILQNFGIVMKTQQTVDVNSPQGQRLKADYQVTKVPIILLSPDAEAYPNLVQAWKSVGSVEQDGWYVMRSPELLGSYKDLTTGKVVKQAQPAEG